MKLMQTGMIIFLIGVSMADSPKLFIPISTILLGMALMLVGGKHEGIF